MSINVENAPFLVTKLRVQVLPCVICFIDGIGTDRILGFEGVGYNTEDITLRDLEDRLLSSNVLVRAKMIDQDEYARQGRGNRTAKPESDDDDDWD